jgi:P22_AR N-terminal domain/ORF6C domain
MMSDDAEPIGDVTEPTAALPVTLFETPVLAVRAQDGSIYLSIRDVSQSISIGANAQLRRLRNHAVLREGLRRFRVNTGGGPQVQDFLLLEHVPTWLLMINAARVSEGARTRLTWFQKYIVRKVYSAFAEITGLPDGESRQIEDLEDLTRFDTALRVLADRQGEVEARQDTLETRQSAIEASQDKARQVWLDVQKDLRALRQQVEALQAQRSPEGKSITKAQRGYLYQLVQAWGAALAERDPRVSKSAAHATCWAAFKRHFVLSQYEDLPAARYAEAVAFIQAAYRKLTGVDLEIPEQNMLDLGDV